MPYTKASASIYESLIPWYFVGIVALLSATTLIVIGILGPAVLNVIHYRTSPSGIQQTIAFDITDMVLLASILFIGGVLQLLRKQSAKYFLILTPITLMTIGFEYGLGQEWSNPTMTGNVEAYIWLYLILIICGLVLLLGSLSSFTREDAPRFNQKWLRVYVGVMIVFLALFAVMWAAQVYEVIRTGSSVSGDYTAAPTAFWVVRFFDLGITIPIGFIAMLLLLFKPQQVYSILLLFFGFFITLGTSVNVSALLLVIKHDPSVSGTGAGGLIIFPVLGILAYAGLLYLVKDKFKRTHVNT
jgi:hypothetical protein